MTTNDPYPGNDRRERVRCPHCGAEITIGETAMKDEEGRVIQLESEQALCPECGEALTTKGGPQDPLPEYDPKKDPEAD